MVSNYEYQDTTPSEKLNAKQLRTLTYRSLLLQASFNYERMQAAGWLYSILPGLRQAHKNKKDLSKAMKDHLEFFNTHPFLVTFIMGIILAMEQNKEDREVIRGIKIATMGPLGGIGDALFYLTLLPITASIGASLAIEGNILGPIIFIVVFNIIHFGTRFGLMKFGYEAGVSAIAKLKESTQQISRAASIVGLTVVGGLIATFVAFEIDYVWVSGEAELDIQTEVLDDIMPGLLPIVYTLLVYWLLKRGRSPLLLIGLTVLVGLLGAFLGIM
ncbi:PTS system mannose/fructose/sorbose family transporter subunit IID [Virgibacillus sp. MSJ-26]|uniref:PTS system mannose/fructose/sorbose family transporter subunit IID n=1 Tax=Virgibacillus sp. MSJ-26 TaxID=2841522 RepID=UPI001C11F5EB|nr:PTS system mannose/fructose/sorbose family transporter subunit IID [Virgibacillus sp. MSJ-26]MBU5465423.1 PTS system mannose/fructose/sorbose family transporter subunit IID [Virgibacillus sp. MSJ-26]